MLLPQLIRDGASLHKKWVDLNTTFSPSVKQSIFSVIHVIMTTCNPLLVRVCFFKCVSDCFSASGCPIANRSKWRRQQLIAISLNEKKAASQEEQMLEETELAK